MQLGMIWKRAAEFQASATPVSTVCEWYAKAAAQMLAVGCIVMPVMDAMSFVLDVVNVNFALPLLVMRSATQPPFALSRRGLVNHHLLLQAGTPLRAVGDTLEAEVGLQRMCPPVFYRRQRSHHQR